MHNERDCLTMLIDQCINKSASPTLLSLHNALYYPYFTVASKVHNKCVMGHKNVLMSHIWPACLNPLLYMIAWFRTLGLTLVSWTLDKSSKVEIDTLSFS